MTFTSTSLRSSRFSRCRVPRWMFTIFEHMYNPIPVLDLPSPLSFDDQPGLKQLVSSSPDNIRPLLEKENSTLGWSPEVRLTRILTTPADASYALFSIFTKASDNRSWCALT